MMNLRIMTVVLAVCAMSWIAPLTDMAYAGEEVLITSNRDGNAEIYLVELGGKTQKNLTNNDAEDIYPSWSPDGQKIAFTSSRGGDALNIFVMDADGKNVKQLTKYKGKSAYCSEWSPDGKEIVYVLGDEFVLLNPETLRRQLLTDNAYDPAWSPDGKKIACTKFVEAGYKIHVMDADGQNEQDIGTDANGLGWSYPAWSPNGKKLVYANQVGDDIELFTCDIDGKNNSRITNVGGHNSYAAWSPDGKRILFRQTNRGGADAWPFYWIDPETLNLEVVKELKDEPPLNNDMNPGRPAFRPKQNKAQKP